MKYLVVVMMMVGDVKVAELQYTDPVDSWEDCVYHGKGLARSFMIGFWSRDEVDHYNIPMPVLRCEEQI